MEIVPSVNESRKMGGKGKMDKRIENFNELKERLKEKVCTTIRNEEGVDKKLGQYLNWFNDETFNC